MTSEIDNPRSPVAIWLKRTFPNYAQTQSAYRAAAGVVKVLPTAAVALQTQGSAIDWWLRFLIDSTPSVKIARLGLRRLRQHPCVAAGAELLDQIAEAPPLSGRSAWRTDEWWARASYALALLVEPVRTPMFEGSRLMQLRSGCDADALLALANGDEVGDLITMKSLASARLLPLLPAGPVFSGATFDGSVDLNADADVIVGGVLVDFKASRGGRPRQDGSRTGALARGDLYQLLGYVLLDYSDRYAIHTVAIYAARFGFLASWPLPALCATLAGRAVNLAALRSEFRQLVRDELPEHWEGMRQARIAHS